MKVRRSEVAKSAPAAVDVKQQGAQARERAAGRASSVDARAEAAGNAWTRRRREGA